MVLYPIFGIVSFISIVGYLCDMFLWRSDYVLAALIIVNGPGFAAVKWSNYNNSWRWKGLMQVSDKVLFVWRWLPRMMIIGIVILALFAETSPHRLRQFASEQPHFLRYLIETMMIFFNAWLCGFVFFGDQAVASPSTRKRIFDAKRWLFDRTPPRKSSRGDEFSRRE